MPSHEGCRWDDSDRADDCRTAEAEAGGILTIDLAAIVANWRALRSRAAPAQCAAVVKADGYGCGIEPGRRRACEGRLQDVLRRQSRRSAARPRGRAPTRRSMCSTACCPAPRRATAEANLRPVIGSLARAGRVERVSRVSGWRGGAALHVDTGMNRLGFPLEEAAAARGAHRQRSRHRAGDEPLRLLGGRPSAQRDADASASATMRALFPGIAGSLANSSGIFLGADAHHDLVRPGRRALRRQPDAGQAEPDAPVVTLQAASCRSATVEPGATVGYSATWTAKRADPARHRIGRLRGRISARRERERRAAPARRRSSQGSAARSPAAYRWT